MKELAFTLPGGYRILVPPATKNNANDIVVIINWLPGFIIVLILFASLIFLVYAGYVWATSGGDKAKLEEVRKIVLSVVTGLLIMILSFFILRFVGQYIFGDARFVDLENTTNTVPGSNATPCPIRQPGQPC